MDDIESLGLLKMDFLGLKNLTMIEKTVSLINQSIKNLNNTADFDLKIQKFREKLLNINADVEDLIFDLNSYLQEIETYESNLPEIQKRLFF